MANLIGKGLYTPAEAGRLLRVPPQKITRWLRGHSVKGKYYPALWKSEITLDDDQLILGFRDLMEVRVADAFIRAGVSAIRVRSAIQVAKEVIGSDHPLSTDRFRTDGREIFLRIIEMDDSGEESERLLNLFRRQYEFKGIVEPILKTVDFDDEGEPQQWWPNGRRLNIVIDPERSFGQPIDAETSVPTAILASFAEVQGIEATAKAYEVPETSVRRALEFENMLSERKAA